MSKVLAFDLGASNGRAVIVEYREHKLELQEVYRFPNQPVMLGNHLYWDICRLFHEIKCGLNQCAVNGHRDIASVAIDTWGVDFGLLDRDGDLLCNPYHYRDRRTEGIEEYIEEKIGLERLYNLSGIQNIWFNTSYQLAAMVKDKPDLLKLTHQLLMIPDLLGYFLTGVCKTEFTAASTTQLFKADEGCYHPELLAAFGIPAHIFPPVIQPGQVLGMLKEEIAEESGLSTIPVVATASHDTSAAVVAVPAEQKDFIFISCGTWSLVGTELDSPIVNRETFENGFSNEGTAENRINFLKNIMGLWIAQECKNYWNSQGKEIGFAELDVMAEQSPPFASFIDVEDSLFISPGNMPERIREFCRSTGQPVPEDMGSIIRCATESLAMKYRQTIEQIEAVIGKKGLPVHIIGGGCKNKMLCKATAGALNRRVVAGPTEATATGNAIIQLIAGGHIGSVADGRSIVKNSVDIAVYEPEHHTEWDAAYKRYREIMERKKS